MLHTAFSRFPRASYLFTILSFLLVFLVVNSSAQSFRGKILGTVTDPNGAVVQGATVAAKNVGTGIERTTTTDADGNYSLAELPIGTYEVTVSQGNFKPQTIKNVIVEVAGERRADATLSASADVTVNVATEEQVETTSTTLGGTIQARAVADLPVNGRDFTKFLVLVQGASGDPSGATDSPG